MQFALYVGVVIHCVDTWVIGLVFGVPAIPCWISFLRGSSINMDSIVLVTSS